jgi:antitoxin (DNA-binding transcriptional repressor) of toxin-antitoxin stability system
MTGKIIGIKELHKNLKNVSEATLRGERFVVIKNSKPVFQIIPLEDDDELPKHSLTDLKNLQFNSREKNLSKNIDKVLY